MADAASAPEPVRDCGGCTLCCRVMGIAALDKPAGIWCPHCEVARSCKIYEARPEECRTFNCVWILDGTLGDEWKPSLSKLCMVRDAARKRLLVHVDPHRPDAWRREPYYAQLKAWAKAAAPAGRQVLIGIGARRIAVLPDGETDLGVVGPDDFIVTQPRPSGRGWEAFKAAPDDPRIGALRDLERRVKR